MTPLNTAFGTLLSKTLAGTALLTTSLLPMAAVANTADDEHPVETMTVTGTRLANADPAGVVTISRDEIARSGAVTLNAVMKEMVFGAAGVIDEQFTQGFAPASSSVDLRGMGVSRTLVLVDGRRMPVFPFARGGSESFVDLNTIPLGNIERIEVLKDGASAIYGADAVAGVVNIITRRGGTGTQVSARVSATSESDGEEAYLTLNSGVVIGESELGFSLDYLDRDPIWARDRDLTASANGPIDARSLAGNPGTFITSLGPVPDAACPPSSLSGPFCTYDFAQDVTLVPGVERIGAGASWDLALTPEIGVFARINYTTSESDRDLAAAPNAYPVSAANPNNPFGEDVLAIYRLNDIGPRVDRFETDAYTFLAGINGVTDGWLWEIAAGTSNVDSTISGVNGYAIAADVQAAIDAGTLNVFGASPGFDPASVSYETKRSGESDVTFFDFRLNGRAFDIGGVRVESAFGAEFRQEDFDENFDPLTASGAVIGVGGVSADGDRDVWALFAEFGIPLSDTVDVTLAARYDDYSDFGGTFNPKLGASWAATENLTLRASAATGFKAPALHELYAGDIFAFQSIFDTTNCEAARAANDAAGIAQYCDSVLEVTSIASGNSDLDAEESDSFSVGADWEFAESWTATVDYWRIENENAVVSSPQFYVDNEARFPGNVVRNGAGDITTVLSPFDNVAEQELWGVDLVTHGEIDLESAGALELSFTAAYLGSFEQAPSPGEPAEEFAGKDGYAEWRAASSMTWSHNDVSATLGLNFVDGYERQSGNDDVDASTTVNLQANWSPDALRGGSVSLGANNVLDEEPPEDPFLEGWPFFNRALHNPRGRFFYLRYTHEMM